MKKQNYLKCITVAALILCLLFSMYFGTRRSRYEKNKNSETCIALIEDNKAYVVNNKKVPMMSIFKFFVALKVFDKLDKEKLSLGETIKIEKDMVDESLYSPMLKDYKGFPFEISIRELLRYMMPKSDNNACDILIDYAGGVQAIGQYLKDLGFYDVDISANEKEMNKKIELQYANKAYPIDVLKAMKIAREGSILSLEHKEFLDEIMIGAVTGKDKIVKGVPKGVIVGHKTGSSSRDLKGVKVADNDAGFVILPNDKTYYLAVFVLNSGLTDSENAETIAEISKKIYNSRNVTKLDKK